MSTLLSTFQNNSNLNGIIDLYNNRELNIQRKYILIDMLKTLEIFTLDLKNIIENSHQESNRYYENLINYFYHCFESIDEQIERLDYLNKKTAHQQMDEIENRITFLSDSIKKISTLINNKEKIRC
jgi:uncharacterized membrane protein